MRFLLIDNYDSFIYNLRYDLNSLGVDITVCRNDIDYEQLQSLANTHDAIVISPGPSNPDSAGHCLKLTKEFYSSKPILGICLGHQTIAQAMGGSVVKARQLRHGKTSKISLESSPLFSELGDSINVARYHSLIAQKLPDSLRVTAFTNTNEIMAIEHHDFPVYGVQFHPESIMSLQGSKILNNFKSIVQQSQAKQERSHVANA